MAGGIVVTNVAKVASRNEHTELVSVGAGYALDTDFGCYASHRGINSRGRAPNTAVHGLQRHVFARLQRVYKVAHLWTGLWLYITFKLYRTVFDPVSGSSLLFEKKNQGLSEAPPGVVWWGQR